MDRRLVVLTAIVGGYERPKEPPRGADRCVMLTDGSVRAANGWENLHRPDHGLSRLRHFFVAKLLPHVLLDEPDADFLWIDGSMVWNGRDPKELVQSVPVGGVGIHRHHARSCYHEEGLWTHGQYPKHERGTLAREQAETYKQRGCPTPSGLWETGIIVWRGGERRIGERWFAETMTWSSSDQVSLPYVLHLMGERVTPLPGPDVYHNAWFSFVPHGR